MPSSDGKSVGGDNNHFYSINIGPVHLISFSTEFYFYFYKYGILQLSNQFTWLENDLKKANLPENRAKQPCSFYIYIYFAGLILLLDRKNFKG